MEERERDGEGWKAGLLDGFAFDSHQKQFTRRIAATRDRRDAQAARDEAAAEVACRARIRRHWEVMLASAEAAVEEDDPDDAAADADVQRYSRFLAGAQADEAAARREVAGAEERLEAAVAREAGLQGAGAEG